MLARIENKVLEKYPEAEIGYLVAKVAVNKNEPFVNELKAGLMETVKAMGIDATNFVSHPNISIWRKIYQEDFNVKIQSHNSSVEALLTRIVKGKKLWDICNIVDLYNCCSIAHLLPMGGYDLGKVCGDITIRYGQEGDSFLGLGRREPVEVESNHVIYADEVKVLCWLWNYQDSSETCIDGNTKEVVFFIDSVQRSTHQSLKKAIQELMNNLEKINCISINHGILNLNSPQAILK